MKAGAVTLLEKPYDEDELWDAIRKALAREAVGRAEAQHRGRNPAARRFAYLRRADRHEPDRPRQAQQELSPNSCSQSVRTVESRRHEVFAKMKVDSVAELVRLAIDGELAT